MENGFWNTSEDNKSRWQNHSHQVYHLLFQEEKFQEGQTEAGFIIKVIWKETIALSANNGGHFYGHHDNQQFEHILWSGKSHFELSTDDQ